MIRLVHVPLSLAVLILFSGCDSRRLEPEDFPRKELDDVVVSSPDSRPSTPTPPVQLPPAEAPGGDIREAALQGDLLAVEAAMAAGTPAHSPDDQQRTPLHLASFDGHTAVVKVLLAADVEVDHRDGFGRTALMYASTANNVETVRTLLDAGADPNLVDGEEHFTPLMFAAAEGQTEVVKLLIAGGAKTDTLDIDGESALDFAKAGQHTPVIELLQK